MKTSLITVSVLLFGTAMAADSPEDCTITAVRERVLAEQSGGPQRAIEEGQAVSSAKGPAVFEVVVACGQKKYFAVFTAGSKFNRGDFDTRRAVRASTSRTARSRSRTAREFRRRDESLPFDEPLS